MNVECPLCYRKTGGYFSTHSTYDFFECKQCEFIFVNPLLINRIDAGEAIFDYGQEYWRDELKGARERSYGPALARTAEILLYANRPVTAFLDIGTGPGYLLDALSTYLPSSKSMFYGIETFPPSPEFRSHHANYKIGSLADLPKKFQAGTCIEVLEHLTPKCVENLARELASISEPEAIYLFNTGLVEYVKKECPSYLDPRQSGHIVSWSVKSARKVFGPHGFTVRPIPGKTWAFTAEYQSKSIEHEDIRDRIWKALPQNKDILNDPKMGSVLYVLGFDTVRASLVPLTFMARHALSILNHIFYQRKHIFCP
jgi:hypothetical protein